MSNISQEAGSGTPNESVLSCLLFLWSHAFEESRAEWLPGRGRRYQAKILQPVLCLMGGKIKKVKEKQPKKSDLWCRDLPQKKKESFCMS